MMQHAAAIDDVETAAERAEPQNVGLPVFDVAEPGLVRLAPGVGQTRHTEVDRENARAGRAPRKIDQLLAGPAAGNQNIDGAAAAVVAFLREIAKPGERKVMAQPPVDRCRLGQRRGLHPARVGVLLVLLAHQQRDAILDRRQRGNAGTQAPLGRGLADLLREDGFERGGPRPFKQGFMAVDRVQGKI